jgi:hypothetical protein
MRCSHRSPHPMRRAACTMCMLFLML